MAKVGNAKLSGYVAYILKRNEEKKLAEKAPVLDLADLEGILPRKPLLLAGLYNKDPFLATEIVLTEYPQQTWNYMAKVKADIHEKIVSKMRPDTTPCAVCGMEATYEDGKFFCANESCIIHRTNYSTRSADEWNTIMSNGTAAGSETEMTDFEQEVTGEEQHDASAIVDNPPTMSIEEKIVSMFNRGVLPGDISDELEIELSDVEATLIQEGLMAEKKPEPEVKKPGKWTQDDNEKLEFLFKAGKTVEDLTEIFNRDAQYIEKKLLDLDLIDPEPKPEPKKAEKPKRSWGKGASVVNDTPEGEKPKSMNSSDIEEEDAPVADPFSGDGFTDDTGDDNGETEGNEESASQGSGEEEDDF